MSSTLADLQRRNIEQMGSRDLDKVEALPLSVPEPQVDTDVRTYALTEVRADASAEASNEAMKDVSTQGQQEGRKAARKEGRAEVSKAARKEVYPNNKPESFDRPEFLDKVEAALASREPLTGGVKATVDMSPELSTRAKRYLADHRGQNTRQVLIALFDAFLNAKGY